MAKDEPIDDSLYSAREDDGQIYVERDKIDFDPDDGLLSGTAIDGTSDVPDADRGGAGGESSDDAASETEGDPAR